MEFATSASIKRNATEAVEELSFNIRQKVENPDLLIVVGTVEHSMPTVHQLLRKTFPNTPLQGGTSCAGVMTDAGFAGDNGCALAAFAIQDERGAFGVGSAELSPDPQQAAINATLAALRNADRPGELPSAIWIMAAPGFEEEVVAGITSVVGPEVPLIGGSSADNTIEGHWQQLDSDGVYQNAITVAVIFTQCYISTAFHMGYDASSHQGTVTKADDRRLIEIDGRPAAQVYNEWTGGGITDLLSEGGGNILSVSNLFPLGRPVGRYQGIDCYQLSHPETCNEAGELTLFTDVSEGESLVCMTGDVDNLVKRASQVAKTACLLDDLTKDQLRAGLVIFCAGCFLTVQDRIEEVHHNFQDVVGDIPFLTAFTFGEQGRMLDGGNKHGNLMISTLLFSDWET